MSTTEDSSDNIDFPEIESANLPSDNQQLFLRYFTAVLVDLLVLNLMAEYWVLLAMDSFTVSVVAALLLQILLQVTLHIEHRIALVFKGKPGALAKFLRIFCAWLVLFGSKFVMLFFIDLVLGDAIRFGGPFHGVVVFIAVVITILASEELIARFYRSLA